MNDTIQFTGTPTITLYGPDGEIKSQQTISNLVVTAGKNFFASRAVGTATAVMSYMAVGTNNTSPVAGDTTLGTEIARVALTSSVATGNTVTYVATFPAGTGTGALTEAGILNAASAGTLLAHTVFSVVNKDTLDSLTISWNVTAS